MTDGTVDGDGDAAAGGAGASDGVAVGDHYRAGTGTDLAPGVYRVVGTREGEVTLLRVADADGRRVHSGTVSYVPVGVVASALDPADDPDAGFSPLDAVAGLLDGMVWELRSLLGR